MFYNLAKIVLKDNIFKFGKKTLKQKTGTIIGKKIAPPSVYDRTERANYLKTRI